MRLLLGSPDGDHLALTPLRRSHPEATDFWDGNWLKVDVTARGGAFRGAFEADLRADELQAFADGLAALQPDGQSRAALESMEGWVALRLSLDGRGRLQGTCEVRDDPALGATLRFPLTVEPGELPAVFSTLRAILEAFPVVGDADEASGEAGGALLAAAERPDAEAPDQG